MIEYYSSYKTKSGFFFFFSSAWPVTKIIQTKSSNEGWRSFLIVFFYWQIVFIFFFFLLAKVEQINKPPRNSSINIPNHPYFQLNLQKIKANSNTDLHQLRIYSNNSVGQITFNQFGHEMMYFTKKRTANNTDFHCTQ